MVGKLLVTSLGSFWGIVVGLRMTLIFSLCSPGGDDISVVATYAIGVTVVVRVVTSWGRI